MILTVSSKNISKCAEEESEDCIVYNTNINNRYTVIVHADGNGTLGARSKRVYLDGKTYSEIALSTQIICNYIKDELTKHLEEDKMFDVETIRRIILDGLIFSTRNVYCCILILIVNHPLSMMYSYSVGDCSYSIYDIFKCTLNNKSKDPVDRIVLRDEMFVPAPASICTDCLTVPMIYYRKEELPNKYCILTYSDGLAEDVQIPRKVLGEINTLKKFNAFMNNPRYHITNMSKVDLYKIIRNNFKDGCECIIDNIIQHIFPLKRLDDVSVCVLMKN